MYQRNIYILLLLSLLTLPCRVYSQANKPKVESLEKSSCYAALEGNLVEDLAAFFSTKYSGELGGNDLKWEYEKNAFSFALNAATTNSDLGIPVIIRLNDKKLRLNSPEEGRESIGSVQKLLDQIGLILTAPVLSDQIFLKGFLKRKEGIGGSFHILLSSLAKHIVIQEIKYIADGAIWEVLEQEYVFNIQLSSDVLNTINGRQRIAEQLQQLGMYRYEWQGKYRLAWSEQSLQRVYTFYFRGPSNVVQIYPELKEMRTIQTGQSNLINRITEIQGVEAILY